MYPAVWALYIPKVEAKAAVYGDMEPVVTFNNMSDHETFADVLIDYALCSVSHRKYKLFYRVDQMCYDQRRYRNELNM